MASLTPSEKARASGAPVESGLQSLQPGDMATVEWRGKPVFVVRRSQAMLDTLARHDELLVDPNSRRANEPDYARNGARSIKPEFFVVIGICTHLGCIPGFRPTPGSEELGATWPGGFYCPRRGSKFDLTGRVFKNVPAPTNLEVPPYHFASASTLLVGVDPAA